MLSQDEQWLLNDKYNGEKTEGFFTDCNRLKSGEPLAYVIGSIPFLNTTIYLDSHPLIPRSETEYWTEKAIAAIQQKLNSNHSLPSLPNQTFPPQVTASLSPTSVVKVLDLCAGSGAIGVAVAKAIPEAIVHFAELDKSHLATIGKNLEENQTPCTRYRVWQSDLFENIAEQYNFILTNPPYIDRALDRTQTSVKDHEPHLALYGGEAGLELIEKIIQEAPVHLHKNGQLWIEHEPEQAAAIAKLASQYNFSSVTKKDQFEVHRYSILTKKISKTQPAPPLLLRCNHFSQCLLHSPPLHRRLFQV